jgi:AcrR family transcriptional regulator
MTRKTDPKYITPRKQPLQKRSGETVSAILEATAHILQRSGLTGLSTNSIAERAGVSIGSLYQYFPNKDAIIARLITKQTQCFERSVTAALEKSSALPLKEALETIIDFVVDYHAKHQALERVLQAEEKRLPLEKELFVSQANIIVAIERFLSGYCELSRANIPIASQTIMLIVRSLADSYTQAEEPISLALKQNVNRAVCGYLQSW